MTKPIWIELVDSGVGARYEFEDEEVIEMNWRLVMYPELYRKVFLHEINHDDGDMNIKDFVHDMKSRTPGLFSFMRKHISAWTIILPLYYSKRHSRFIFDWNTIISWIMLFAMAGSVYWLLTFIGGFL